MAFKLDRQQKARRDHVIDQLREASEAVEAAVEALNASIAEHREKIEEAVSAYNELVETAGSLAEEIASDAREQFDEKSEKWQEGERGQEASQYVEDWENISFDTLEPDVPDDMDVPDMQHADDLEALPVFAGG